MDARGTQGKTTCQHKNSELFLSLGRLQFGGIDMVGLFSKSPCHKTHLLVAVDKFTKWVKVEPVSRVDGASAVRFFKKIATRFGYPHSIITDNGTNLSIREMAKFCGENNIRLDLASVAHPQSNGQAERANQE